MAGWAGAVLLQPGTDLVVIDVHEGLVVDRRSLVVAHQECGLGSGGEAEQMGGPKRESRLGDGKGRRAVFGDGMQKREVEAVVETQRFDEVVGGDGHGEKEVGLGQVAGFDRAHDPPEEAVGRLPGRHGVEVDGRGWAERPRLGRRRRRQGDFAPAIAHN